MEARNLISQQENRKYVCPCVGGLIQICPAESTLTLFFFVQVESTLQEFFHPSNHREHLAKGSFSSEAKTKMYTGWSPAHTHSPHTHICAPDCLTFTFLMLDSLESTAFKCKYDLRYRGENKPHIYTRIHTRQISASQTCAHTQIKHNTMQH